MKRRFVLSRIHYLVGLLLLVLVLTGVLATEALQARASHRAAAASALDDTAAFVAWRYGSLAQSKLEWGIAEPTIQYLKKSRDKYDWNPGEEILDEYGEPIECAFTIDQAAFTIEPDGDGFTIRQGDGPKPVVQEWIVREIAARIDTYDPEWPQAMIAGAPDGETHIVFYDVEFERDERTPKGVIGFEVDLAALPEMFEYAFDHDLLPPSLTGGRPNEEMLTVKVVGPAGDVLWKNDAEASWEFFAVDRLEPQFGELEVAVAIAPAMAEALVIGGLPKSRLPLIGTLLALAGILVAAAIVLLRREMEIGRIRTEFVSNVSHELRTPLAQIRMYVETLLLGRVRSEEERRKSLEIMNREIRRLGNLVENILAFSRAERGAMDLKFEPTDLAPLCEEVAEAFRPLAIGRHMNLETECHDGAIADVDRAAIKQILLNLLDNAVKYGPEGQTVWLGIEADGGTVRFHVDDEGPGIPPEKRAAVWDAFVRLDREREAATAGTGIGLSVVRELVTRHGGRVWVETGPAGGARFCVELPRKLHVVEDGESEDAAA